jgi:hypothetical protein
MRQSDEAAGPAEGTADCAHCGQLGDALVRRLGAHIRQVLARVGRFRELVVRQTAIELLAPVVHELANGATECFLEAALLRTDGQVMNPDHALCLGALRDLVQTLRGPNPPPHEELMHSLDCLIMHFAVLDADRRDPLRRWQSLGDFADRRDLD